MIALLGKYVKKLLLGPAVAAQNRAQDIVAKLQSIEEDEAKGGDQETTPTGAKPETADREDDPRPRSGRPPDHWVQLVKRHAPELLCPGPPYVVPQPPSRVAESETRTAESIASDFNGSKPPKAPPQTGPLFKRRDKKNRAADFLRPDEVRAALPRQRLDGAAATDSVATQGKSVGEHHPALSTLGEKKTTRLRSSSVEPDERRIHPNERRATTQAGGELFTGKDEVRSSLSTAGPTGPAGSGETDQKTIQKDSGQMALPESRSEGVDHEEHSRKADPQVVPATSAPRQIKQGTDYRTVPGPLKSLDASPSSPATAVGIADTQSKREAHSLRDGDDVRPIHGQLKGHPPEARGKEEEQALPGKRAWPSLPGEDDSEVVGDPQLTAYWPTLPADPLAQVKPLSDQVELRQSEAELRKSERLQRLDEEQKGLPWSE